MNGYDLIAPVLGLIVSVVIAVYTSRSQARVTAEGTTASMFQTLNESQQKRIDQLGTVAAQRDGVIAGLEAQYDVNKDEIHKLRYEIDSLKVVQETLRGSNYDLNAEIKSIRAENKDLKQQIVALNATVASLVSKNERLENEKAAQEETK